MRSNPASRGLHSKDTLRCSFAFVIGGRPSMQRAAIYASGAPRMDAMALRPMACRPSARFTQGQDAQAALEAPPAQGAPSLQQCVFRVECVRDKPRFDMPLLLGSLATSSRTAFALSFEGQRFLVTAASAVSYSTRLKVFKPGADDGFLAKVQHISLECEVALLSIVDEHDQPTTPVRRRITRASARVSRQQQGAHAATAADGEAEDWEEGASAVDHMPQEDRFWQGVQPLQLGTLPAVQQPVQILTSVGGESEGEGEDERSASSPARHPWDSPSPGPGPGPDPTPSTRQQPGSVSSVQVVPYPASMSSLLGLVVSAKVGSSSIGAPVVTESGTCVGLVMRRVGAVRRQLGRGTAAGVRRRGRPSAGHLRAVHQEAQAVAVPVPVMRRLLEDVATQGSFQGLPSLSFQYKALVAGPIRQALQMAEGEQGVLILAVNLCGAASKVLQPGDVLMRVNGMQVNNEGKVAFRGAELMQVSAFLAQHPVGSQVDLTIFRAGQVMQATTRLDAPPRLLPTHLGNHRPQFLVVGGLVLTRCSVPYLESAFGSKWVKLAPIKLLDKLTLFPSSSDEQVVVVAECQPLPCMDGYQAGAIQHKRVLRFNGEPVVNLRQLARMAFKSRCEFHRFDLEGGMTVVLSSAQAAVDTKVLLQQYQVKLAVSEDLADELPAHSTGSKGHQKRRKVNRPPGTAATKPCASSPK